MEFNLKIGLTCTKEKVVSYDDTAAKYGSGMVKVFATPAMIALMENTAMKAVINELPEGFNTVGTQVCVNHIKATPIGMKVRCDAILIKKEGKKLEFKVTCWDDKAKIGEGTHTRFIINVKDFMDRL